jgi:hypothetical protein
MAELAAISAIASIAGGGIGAMGAMQQGAAAKAAGEYQNKVDIAQGKQAFAESQIPEFNQYRKGDAEAGKFRTIAAGSGAGGGPTVKELYGQMASLNETQADEELFKGQQKQQAYNVAGANALYQGQVQKDASMWNAAGTFLSGASKAFAGKTGSDFNFT